MVVTGIEILDNLNLDADVLLVSFDDDTQAYMFYKYADAMKFVNQDVIVTFREDMYKGEVVSVVNTFTETTRVHTLESDDNIKLYSEDVDNHSNVVFADLEDGSTMIDAIMFCTECSYESSNRASWVELTVRDSRFKLKKLRLFDYDNANANLKGRYIKCDIRKNKYGLSSNAIIPDDTLPLETPDVAICRNYVMSYFQNRQSIRDMLEKMDFWDKCSCYVSGCAGGEYVSLAYELRTLSTYKDMLPGLNYDALDLALLATHMFVTKEDDDMSHELRGIIALSSNPVDYRLQAMKIIDGEKNDTLSAEKALFKNIRETASQLIGIRYD